MDSDLQDRIKAGELIRLGPADKCINDLFDALCRARDLAFFTSDVSKAIDFCKAYRQRTGRRLTFTAFIVKACALAIERDPRIHYMLRGNRYINPSSVDIGLSVAGRTRLAPVITIREAEHKSLEKIASEIDSESHRVREEEVQSIQMLGMLARIIPIGFVRRWLLRFVIRRQRVIRKTVGTFQITNPGSLGIEGALSSVLTTSLLVVGAIVDRVIPVDGRPAVRPTVHFVLQVDHKLMEGQIVASFIHGLNEILADPESSMDIPAERAAIPEQGVQSRKQDG